MKKTVIFKVDPNFPDKEAIRQCACLIKRGGLVAFPTETVYGLGASLKNKTAVKELYKVKARPKNKPFTVHISSLSAIKLAGCVVTKKARRLIDKFWPGPLTIILKSKSGKKIGFRMPANKVALELIRKSGVPVVAPSANLSGSRPPKNAKEVLKSLDGRIDALIDAGRTAIGVESTVVDLTVEPIKILRRGAVKEADLLRTYE